MHVGKGSDPQIHTQQKWLQHPLKFDFVISSGTWLLSESMGQIQQVLSYGLRKV